MEQRRLRLGDILDDYCPRERRVTNHAVVAMIEENVKQTRCTTCDAEHLYKGGKEPRRRSRKDSPEGLFREVLAGMPDTDAGPGAVAVPESRGEDLRSVDELQEAALASQPPVVREDPPLPQEDALEEPQSPASVEDGPFHRRLIRAQLPRPEGQKEVRQVPDFTIRSHNNGRGHFRGIRGQSGAGQPGGNGHGAGGRPPGRRFSGGGNPGMPGGRTPSPGAGRGGGRGPSAGPGRGPSPGGGRGPRKRSR
jgi:hypothetical protein